ncbi:aminodeoxychorismate synthase component I [Luteithermobacter gelatinilyticus]|uniref:aminodeoxychorismate synthase component I n=1 Tax=Luteithermobacter gelatinilyticus TaxID=2582913 RepID=UPI001105E39C|nr:aminodeoxychorismate synthase component I [Luteithermobacter gelatinilyticus]
MPVKNGAGQKQHLRLFLDDSLAQGTAGRQHGHGRHGYGNETGGVSYLYESPLDVITVNHPEELTQGFTAMEEALAAGYHLAGWISYESGLTLEERLRVHLPPRVEVPYLCFGVFDGRRRYLPDEAERYWREREERGRAVIGDIRLSKAKAAYLSDIARIHEYLRAGDIYQVNYTLRAEFDFEGDSSALYAALRRAQRVSYGAYIQTADQDILSLSPELFLRRDGNRLLTRPMKGTLRRGRTVAEDQNLAARLREDEKNRAENLMIVDLLRNDLSKLARPGSVKVHSLYDVEKYATLFQMTSSIEAEVAAGVKNTDILRAMFPCGSVTGAPKIRAMEIIAELEGVPRGIYTGAIGYLTPDGEMCFNVPIRTVTLNRTGGGQMGIGSGIVADSAAQEEYEECLLKAAFLTRRQEEFALIETMRWTGAGGLEHLDAHLARLKDSAIYFDFACDLVRIRDDLIRHCARLDPTGSWRVRLLLSRDGMTSVTSTRLNPSPEGEERRFRLWPEAVDSRSPYLYHKTTRRSFYDDALQQARRESGCFEVLFTNERGELTEGSFTNLFVEKNGRLYTPPLEAGLLGGILRQRLLDEGRAREKRLFPEDLRAADKLYVGNSVRGLIRGRLE